MFSYEVNSKRNLVVDLEEDYNCTDNYNASMLYSDDI